MHVTDAEGNIEFKCDFCTMPWSDNRQMVEGHRGSIVCSQCLSIAFTEIVHLDSGYSPNKGETCKLCLESDRDGLHWQSPVEVDVIACRRCIKQSAGVLHKDPDIPWKKPADPHA